MLTAPLKVAPHTRTHEQPHIRLTNIGGVAGPDVAQMVPAPSGAPQASIVTPRNVAATLHTWTYRSSVCYVQAVRRQQMVGDTAGDICVPLLSFIALARPSFSHR